ncbi:reverse transcriptase domain-containing protein [Tanacetum coccineum]
MNTASSLGSGSHPGNTIANPKGELKAITTRSSLVLDGPSVLMPPPFINLKEDERAEETLMDPGLVEYTIKKVYPRKKLRDPGKFLLPCGFSELKCKVLADLGASINLMPLSVWKKLGLPELISTRMTLELANRAICTPAGIARDVFVPVGKFTFLADFIIVDYESNPRVPLILGRPFLRTARALIDVHGEEMILRDGDERLILNMKHDTSSYSNKPKKESINMIDIYNVSYEYYLEDLFATNHLSGNPTPISYPIVSSSPTLTSLEESDLIWEEFEAYLILIMILLIPFPEMFHRLEHTLDYSSPPLYDDVDDDLVELESDNDVYDDPFDSKEDKIKESKLLIDELDPLRSNHYSSNTDKNEKKISISNASLILEDFNPPLYELPFHKEVPETEIYTIHFHPKMRKSFQPWDSHF